MLTAAEKEAGRVFRADWQSRLALQPPAARCSGFIREYRHACPKQHGASSAIRMREHSTLSPAYLVRREGGMWLAWPALEAPEEGLTSICVPAGVFAFLWLDGKCACGFRVRSPGRVMLTAELLEEKSG